MEITYPVVNWTFGNVDASLIKRSPYPWFVSLLSNQAWKEKNSLV
jgi:hypothetical protein